MIVDVAYLPGPGDASTAPRLVVGLAAQVLDVSVGRARLVRACPARGSDRHGVPVLLLDDRPSRLQASLSRAPGAHLAAVSAVPVGVDVEACGAADFEGFASVALPPAEVAGDARARTVTWVRKEAVLKATGRGLVTDPRALRLTPPDAAPRVLVGPASGLVDLRVDGYTAALAVLGSEAPEPRRHVIHL